MEARGPARSDDEEVDGAVAEAPDEAMEGGPATAARWAVVDGTFITPELACDEGEGWLRYYSSKTTTLNKAARRPAVSAAHVARFRRDGFVVVEGVLDGAEVARARRGFYASVGTYGVDATNFAGIGGLSSTHGAGGVLDLFYEPWKLDVALSPRYAEAYELLLNGTYATNAGLWTHPQGRLSSVPWAHVDRVGFRLPERSNHATTKRKKVQRSLTPHLDCCPDRLHGGGGKAWPRWRPIQCLLALTSTLKPDEGGFECVPGFHRDFEAYYAAHAAAAPTKHQLPCVGDYLAVSSAEPALLGRFRHVAVPAGAAVFWDQRIPHANARRNDAEDPRLVVYGGFLPRGPELNAAYAAEQRRRLLGADPQPDFWMGPSEVVVHAPDPSAIRAHLATLPPDARRLLGLDDHRATSV